MQVSLVVTPSIPLTEGTVVEERVGDNLEFRPSCVSAAIEATVVAVLLALTFAVFGYFNAIPMWFSVTFGLAFGALVFAFYFGRFMRKAPLVVRLSDHSLSIVYRSREERVSLADVRDARHESDFGLQWRVELQTRSIVLRDDGFSTTQWGELSRAITEKLQALDIPVETKGLADAFVDDGVEPKK